MNALRQRKLGVWFAVGLALWMAPPPPGWGEEPTSERPPRVELSLRSWLYSTGETQWSHDASGLNPIFGDPTSTLKYKDNDTHLVGLGVKTHLNRRVYLDGEFGLSVDFDRGTLIDDDYFAGQRLISRTSSNVSGKGTWYVSGNVGIRAVEFQNDRGHVDVLAGFQYWRTTYEAAGIHLNVCDTSIFTCGPNSPTAPAIKNTTHWITPFQIGGKLEYRVVPRVSVNLKMLFSPISGVYNEDIHFQRSDLQQDPSFSMWGIGIGGSAEPSISLALTRHLTLTGGYRVMWNRTYYGRWDIHPIASATESAPLTEFQTLRHGAVVALTAAF